MKKINNAAPTHYISVEADISDALDTLEKLGAKKSTMMRRMLSGIGTAAKNQAKKRYKASGLKKRSGALYKSISRRVLRNGKGVIIEAKAKTESGISYGYVLSKGSVIKPKTFKRLGRNQEAKKALVFQIEGKWVFAKSVKIPEHNFIVEPVMDYLKTTAFKEKVDKLMQKEIDRIEKEKAKNS